MAARLTLTESLIGQPIFRILSLHIVSQLVLIHNIACNIPTTLEFDT